MPNDDLTFVEKSVLLILMAEAIEVSNTDLTNKYRVKVAVPSREKLKRLGLITTRTENRRLHWDLTDLGWKRGYEELGADIPPAAGAGGAALYATLHLIRRYLDRGDVPYQEFYQPDGLAATLVPATDTEVETRIRDAYSKLMRGPGAWVKLADLRDRLGGLAREQVDAVLSAMNRTPEVSIIPETNQKTLTNEDRDAALVIGDQEKHLIAIGS